MKPTARDYVKAAARISLVESLEFKIKNMALVINAMFDNLTHAHDFITKNFPMPLEQKAKMKEHLAVIRKAKDKVLE